MKGVAVLLSIFMLLNSVTGQIQGLEITFDRERSSPGIHIPCGNLTCHARGNSMNLQSVTVSVVKDGDDSRDLLTVTASKQDTRLSGDDTEGHGTFQNNRANINLDLLQPSLCDSSYFICEVVYQNKSGETDRQFAVAGPVNDLIGRKCQTSSQPQWNLNHVTGPSSLQSWLLQKQIDDINSRHIMTSLNNLLNSMKSIDQTSRYSRLEDRLLRKVLRLEDEVFNRLSGLEDRVSSLPLTQSPTTIENVTTPFEVLEDRVIDLEEAVRAVQKQDEPEVCEHGMGNDLSKSYRPYVVMNQSTIQKEILCDTQTDGGGWIVFQRRAKGNVDFYRDWSAYREGFGPLTGDFWLGNEAIHKLTDQHPYELRIDLRFNGEERFARYASFRLENESDNYRLRLGTHSGTIGWGFSFVNNMPFSTFDRDNDASPENCAVTTHSSWWFMNQCHAADLNGILGERSPRGVCWSPGARAWLYPTFTEMKMRRVRSTSTSG